MRRITRERAKIDGVVCLWLFSRWTPTDTILRPKAVAYSPCYDGFIV